MTYGELREAIKDKPWNEEVTGLTDFVLDVGNLRIETSKAGRARGLPFVIGQHLDITVSGRKLNLDFVTAVTISDIRKDRFVTFAVEYAASENAPSEAFEEMLSGDDS